MTIAGRRSEATQLPRRPSLGPERRPQLSICDGYFIITEEHCGFKHCICDLVLSLLMFDKQQKYSLGRLYFYHIVPLPLLSGAWYPLDWQSHGRNQDPED
jgi:hypothetical protein